jgi:hypothetical protein
MMAWPAVLGCCAAVVILLCAAPLCAGEPPAARGLRGDDVVIMNAAAPDVYKAYGTTFLAWGGAHDLASVR